jgi:hypothetical protein
LEVDKVRIKKREQRRENKEQRGDNKEKIKRKIRNSGVCSFGWLSK